jgi:hypothetical protein
MPGMRLPDPLTPEALEQLRRSIVLLTPGQPSGLDRDSAVLLIEALQRHSAVDRRHGEMVAALRAILEGDSE